MEDVYITLVRIFIALCIATIISAAYIVATPPDIEEQTVEKVVAELETENGTMSLSKLEAVTGYRSAEIYQGGKESSRYFCWRESKGLGGKKYCELN